MRASREHWEISPKISAFKKQESNLTTGRNNAKHISGYTTTAAIVKTIYFFFPVCSPPTEPENGGYRCHPTPCHRLTQKTVIEYFCDEGYALKGDYKFLTCQNGEWDGPMQISCRLTQGLSPLLTFTLIYYIFVSTHDPVQEMQIINL